MSPAVSKSQFRFMQALAHNEFKVKGLTAANAKEYVSGQSPQGLPERKTPKVRTHYNSGHPIKTK